MGDDVSLVAHMVKNLPAMWKTRVRSLGREDPLEEGMANHSSILAWRIPRTEEPGWLQFMGLLRVKHDWMTNSFSFNGKPELQNKFKQRAYSIWLPVQVATYPSLSTQAEEMRLYWQPVSTKAFTSFPAHCREKIYCSTEAREAKGKRNPKSKQHMSYERQGWRASSHLWIGSVPPVSIVVSPLRSSFSCWL